MMYQTIVGGTVSHIPSGTGVARRDMSTASLAVMLKCEIFWILSSVSGYLDNSGVTSMLRPYPLIVEGTRRYKYKYTVTPPPFDPS
jgi:hypothetical protein